MNKITNQSQKDILKRIIRKRFGIRDFPDKDTEHLVMITEATETIHYILKMNELNMEAEFRYKYKYTYNDIKEIYREYDESNSKLEILKHSNVWLKHSKWFDEYLVDIDNKRNQRQKFKEH